MLVASLSAGLVAVWPLLLFYLPLSLFIDEPNFSERFGPTVSIALASTSFALLTYFPYSFIRRKYGWSATQDFRFHLFLAATLPISMAIIYSNGDTALGDKLLATALAIAFLAVIALPSPLMFSSIVDRLPKERQEN
jgi:hypothetical protein